MLLDIVNAGPIRNKRAKCREKKFAGYCWVAAIAALGCLLLAGCQLAEGPAARRAHADKLAAEAGWQSLRLDTGAFILAAYVPIDIAPTHFEALHIITSPPEPIAAGTLTVYIEGDGLAWLTPSQPAADPSPRDPLALQLALRHPDRAVAWLGRPCQFVAMADWRECGTRYWTDQRFAEAVIAASDAAITQLKRRSGAQRLILIGYSGGGAIAALVAARRTDVQCLLTIAGNLDHREWTRWHGVTPLQGSLDPIDFVAPLSAIAQTHWVGARDTVVGRRLADKFASQFAAAQRPAVVEIADADHVDGWLDRWPGLLAESGGCHTPPVHSVPES